MTISSVLLSPLCALSRCSRFLVRFFAEKGVKWEQRTSGRSPLSVTFSIRNGFGLTREGRCGFYLFCFLSRNKRKTRVCVFVCANLPRSSACVVVWVSECNDSHVRSHVRHILTVGANLAHSFARSHPFRLQPGPAQLILKCLHLYRASLIRWQKNGCVKVCKANDLQNGLI